ncbi:MAG TPA: ribosome small subunit-dependent GTPase A [Myxococcota bacterium]|nr:ribosome small subunit-dependent GTPase A [Myxococcota bacterium]HRY96037.1 ribosome small subunit-dependent GTPase A [Myxococcota bacterium]HSA21429.1 ribosome small subunit-dependent GTPase A [Myxococcota bacterium]
MLARYGWDAAWEAVFAEHRAAGRTPGRVVREDRGAFRVRTPAGERVAHLPGRRRIEVTSPLELPAVGDWLALAPEVEGTEARIAAVLPRRTSLVRRAAGSDTGLQVVAANVERVFLVSGLDEEFNPRRVERMLSLARLNGVGAVILLNKADLCPDPQAALACMRELAPGVPIVCLSALADDCGARLGAFLAPGQTAVLLGASGVGKSTLINRLLGEAVQVTQPVRARDAKGRHATTRRELFGLPAGGLLIDTPGLREVGLWAETEELQATFEDLEALAASCRFRDCRHQDEPGCAVRAAADQGRLEPGRLDAFLRMSRELEELEQKRSRAGEKARGRELASRLKAYRRVKPKGH